MYETDHATKAAVAQLASQIGGHLSDELSQHTELFKKTMLDTAESLCAAQQKIEGAADGLFEKLDERIATLEKSSDGVAKSLNEKTEKFGKEIGDWVGFLSATSHAHSKELDALSSEMAELFNSLKSKLLSSVEEQITVRDSEVGREIKETRDAIAKLSLLIEEQSKTVKNNIKILTCAGAAALLLVIVLIFFLK